MTTDPIADMLTVIRNGVRGRKENVDFPASRIKGNLLLLLKKKGYILNYRLMEDNRQGIFRVYLKKGAITQVKRVSKPGLRVYVGKEDIPRVLNGRGIAVISTSKGIFSDKECRERGLGGEVLCYVW